jgi:hypothetical protein
MPNRLPNPGDALWHLADAQARAVVIREAIADGDLGYAAATAERLEHDLGALRQQLETETRGA